MSRAPLKLSQSGPQVRDLSQSQGGNLPHVIVCIPLPHNWKKKTLIQRSWGGGSFLEFLQAPQELINSTSFTVGADSEQAGGGLGEGV